MGSSHAATSVGKRPACEWVQQKLFTGNQYEVRNTVLEQQNIIVLEYR